MVLKNFEGGALDWVGLLSNCTVGQFLGTSHSLLTHAECTIMHLVSPLEFCMTTVSNYSRVLPSSQKKSKTMVMQSFGGKQGALWKMGKCENSEFKYTVKALFATTLVSNQL